MNGALWTEGSNRWRLARSPCVKTPAILHGGRQAMVLIIPMNWRTKMKGNTLQARIEAIPQPLWPVTINPVGRWDARAEGK